MKKNAPKTITLEEHLRNEMKDPKVRRAFKIAQKKVAEMRRKKYGKGDADARS